MRLIPKKTNYNLKFRIKLQTKKILKRARRLRLQLLKPQLQYNKYLLSQRLMVGAKPTIKGALLPLKAPLLAYPTPTATARLGFRAAQAKPDKLQLSHPVKSNVRQKAWLVQDCELSCRKLNPNYVDAMVLKSPSHDYKATLLFGSYGLMSTDYGKLRSKCMSTLILESRKTLRKKSKMSLRVCCDTPVTARPVETRMGKGKGSVSYWEAKAKAGHVLFEFCGLTHTKAQELLKLLRKKTHLRLKLIN